jgi:hypothetical protein
MRSVRPNHARRASCTPSLGLNISSLANEKLSRLARIPPIAQMRNKHRTSKIPIADSIPRKRAPAEDLDLILREVGDLAIVAAVLGIAKGHDTLDLVLHGRIQVFDGTVSNGGSLAVWTSVSSL